MADTLELPYKKTDWPDIKKILKDLANPAKSSQAPKYLTKLSNLLEGKTYRPGQTLKDTIFAGLDTFVEVGTEPTQRTRCIEVILPFIAQLVLDGENNLPSNQMLVAKQGQTFDKTYDRRFVASLIAMGFLCLLDSRPRDAKLPSLSFKRFYSIIHKDKDTSVMAKLKMVVNYFRRLKIKMDSREELGTMRFVRLVQGEGDEVTEETLRENGILLIPFFVDEENCIEDSSARSLQVDFANKHLGGGVLGNGRVQEEIRFSICPELMAAMYFMETMEPNEAIIIQGFEQYSKYKGYNRTLDFDGDSTDDPEKDKVGNIMTTLLAIDAIPYRFMRMRNNIRKQYLPENFMKEINKALVGFQQSHLEMRIEDECTPDHQDASWLADLDPKYPRPIATGNWGCGAFGGDPQFKVMLQWIAASMAKTPAILFYTFKNPKINNLGILVRKIVREKWTVGTLYEKMADYAKIAAYVDQGTKGLPEFFDFILEKEKISPDVVNQAEETAEDEKKYKAEKEARNTADSQSGQSSSNPHEDDIW